MGTREVNKMSRGQSQTKAQPGRRILGRCKEKDRTNNVVLIDLDSSKLHDFIIVDFPESSQQNPKGSRVSAEDKDSPSSSVISIDDDESSDDKNTGNRDRNGGDRENDTTSSRASQNAEESDGDDCQFVKEKPLPVNLSKCKRTYSGRKLPGNRFGLSSNSESSSSESDSSDCEVMEGSSGNIREQWEQAASRKTMFKNVRNGQSGLDDHVGASGSFNDTPENKAQEEEPGCSGRGSGDGEEANRYTSTTENRSEEDAPRCSGSNGVNNEEENLSTPTPAYAGSTVDPFFSSMENGFLDDLVEKIFQDSSSWFKTQSREKSPFSCGRAGFQHAGKSSMEEPSFSESELQGDLGINYGGSGLSNKDRSPIAPNFWSSREQGGKQSSSVKSSFHDEEEKVPGEHFQFKSQSRSNTSFNNDKTSFNNDKTRSRNKEGSEKKMDKTQVNPAYSLDKDKGKLGKTSFSTVHLPNDTNHKSADFEYKEKPISADPSVRQCNTKPCGETQVNSGVACFKDETRSSVGETSFRTQLQHDTGVIPERVSSQDEEKTLSESSSLSSAQRNDLTTIIQKIACRKDEAELALRSFSNTQPSELCAPEGDGIHDIQNDIIGGREKFKETDQYKRAVEEEWASRQRQLQIQAEEVQRLKKRKKAETLRLLDMERRQKQRLEEMRETQKKDVETLNMKEQIRAEVRKELDKLEVKYHDMASVLRHLGIHVGGGLRPMPREVHTAYKQAMLRFHPDRASRTDIRHQVEAEEKFKLISRLKEKLLPTT